ncbi:glycoprotein 3-alpha-L-fucosyltransferase A-like [Physella acuta]|uniref:glycoprotein 3-alpha-L-fucosyltransferase A-like n=1 Tax=Physella acuta TaxID=109671 RepID=UPI0027DAFD06|nr:glycoprotein 3-alpha-L-fucosyltransferase A-like [Physella acuta]
MVVSFKISGTMKVRCLSRNISYMKVLKTMSLVILLTLLFLAVFDGAVQRKFTEGVRTFFQATPTNVRIRVTKETRVTSPENSTTGLEDLRARLNQLGFEPVEDHEFKSPLIINPWNVRGIRNETGSPKIISSFNSPHWFKTAFTNSSRNEFTECEYSNCEMDFTGKKKESADVLLFFVGYLNSAPPARPPGQIWVKIMWESPINYGYPGQYEPWRSVFNWTISYRVDADVFAPIHLMAWRDSRLLLSDESYLEIARNKTKMATWWVSHCGAESKRDEYVAQLKKHMPVDIYGSCGSLQCSKAACEEMLTTTYRFYLSFENSFCKDYLTEKFYRNFMKRHHVIPVARGGFDYGKHLPQGGFVDASKFPNAAELAKFLIQLGNDHARYATMLKEKDRLAALSEKLYWCDLCKKVHTNNETKMIPDIKEWSHGNTCHAPTDM